MPPSSCCVLLFCVVCAVVAANDCHGSCNGCAAERMPVYVCVQVLSRQQINI